MLICPKCHAENPLKNNFCEKCGTSLKTKPCHQCGAKVEWSAKQCHQCGAITGKIWLALVFSESLTQDINLIETAPENDRNILAVGVSSETDSPPPLAEIITEEVTPFTPVDATETLPEITANQVTDQEAINVLSDNDTDRPAAASYTGSVEGDRTESITSGDALIVTVSETSTSQKTITANHTEEMSIALLPEGTFLDKDQRYQLLADLPARHPGEIVTTTVLDCQPLKQSPLHFLPIDSIPKITQVYLDLSDELPQHFPAVQDSWQAGEQTIILLTNYSALPKLADVWQNPQTSQTQIIDLMAQITQLWPYLGQQNYQQSLVEMDNLYVDGYSSQNDRNANLSIRLQRLYSHQDNGPTIIDLCHKWQTVIAESQRTLLGALEEFLTDIKEGKIQTFDDLSQAIEKLKSEPMPKLLITMPTKYKLVKLESSGNTDVGKQREHNEDYFGIFTQQNNQINPLDASTKVKGLYILCDGMGGHAGGEVASKLGVEFLQKYFSLEKNWQNELPNQTALEMAVKLANNTIYQVNQQEKRSGSGRMGTTLVMALVQDAKVAIVHVGDSRLYRVTKQNGLEQITLDHEVGQREIKRGIDPVIAYARPDAYQLTQALGPRDENLIRPEVQFIDFTEDSLLILGSDGLTDNKLLENHWQEYLAPLLEPQASLEKGVNHLIDLANQYNGHDNITAIIVRAIGELVSG